MEKDLKESVLPSSSCWHRMKLSSQKLPSEAGDRVKSLCDRRKTAKAVLKTHCAHYGLATTGPKNSLAERILTQSNVP